VETAEKDAEAFESLAEASEDADPASLLRSREEA
jgi:hypothetical protein